MKRKTPILVIAPALLALLVGCGTPAMSARAVPPPSPAPPAPGPPKADFDLATASFVAHDKANDWDEAACKEVASRFESIGTAKALFDAGLAFQRCGRSKEARAEFEAALRQDPAFHHARAQLALYRYEADGNLDAAIRTLEQVVVDALFQNVPALVNLAMFQMQRDGASADAKLNLQRALAIDDAYMPAYNQLALWHTRSAKKNGSRVERLFGVSAAASGGPQVQQLELAALVCSQAIAKNPSYAPIHNTAGLIQAELGQVNGAVAEFATAVKLDPKLFEAQMNYAFVNLGFRGFEQAQGAFEKAIEMRPNDYDAHLGRALALRGRITGSEPDFEARIAAVQAELDTAKRIDPNRADAYYNEGILTQEFKTKTAADPAKTKALLGQAERAFKTFLEKAAGKPQYDLAVRRVTGDGKNDPGRLGDIEAMRKFL